MPRDKLAILRKILVDLTFIIDKVRVGSQHLFPVLLLIACILNDRLNVKKIMSEGGSRVSIFVSVSELAG